MKRIIINIHGLILLLAFLLFADNIPGNQLLNNSLFRKHNKTYHPVHISFTNIEFNQEKGKFEILFKFFVDDFNIIINNKYGKNLKLKEGMWDNTYPNIIDKYILEHFSLTIGDKDKTKSSLKFVRKEKTDDSIWLYYDLNIKDKNNKFEVYNSFLNDLYMDQNNLLIFTFKGEQKAYKYDRSNTKEMFSF
jgi:hypothetical protein